MRCRLVRLTSMLSTALLLLAGPALADPVRIAIHLQSLAGLRQAVNRIPSATFVNGPSRTLLLQRLDDARTRIQQDQLLSAADALKADVLPTLDGAGAVADILPASRTRSNVYAALLELHDALRSEAGLKTAGQSNTRVTVQNGIISYKRLNGPSPTLAATPLLGGQFFPFWRGFTEPDPDGPCNGHGTDSAAGCLADPSVFNGDNHRTVTADKLGTPYRTVPWGYEHQIAQDGTATALTAPWSAFLKSADENQVNFVRIFGSFSTIPELGGNFFPWQTAGGVLQVRDAICEDDWDDGAQTGSEGYFDRLRAFIAAADAKGVTVQYTLFVRQEIDPLSIAFGTWSHDTSDVASVSSFTCLDGLTYAMPRETPQQSATRDFFEVENGQVLTPVGRLQRLYIRKLVREALIPSTDVPSGFTNVVFEVMNEPISSRLRPTYPTQEIVRRWQAFVIRTIRETEAELRQQWPAVPASVLSLNAVPSDSRPSGFHEIDVYEWRQALDQAPGDPVLAQLDQVGLINYHGYFTPNVIDEDLSLQGLNKRLAAHVAALGTPGTPRAMAALISTDGVRIGVADFTAPGVNDPLASVAESTTCQVLEDSETSGGDPVSLSRSDCRLAFQVGPCSPDTPDGPIGPECAVAHGVPSLLRVYRTGYRNGVLTGANFALQNFIEDLARRVVTGTGLKDDPGSATGPTVPRVAGAFHFHNQSPFEDAMEDLAKVPRPAPPPVPLDGAAVVLISSLALGWQLRGHRRAAT